MTKYRAKPTVIDGIRFASKKEADRYMHLLFMQRAGLIQGLRMQVPYVIIPKSEHGRAVKYIADFCYMQDGKEIVEDVKGYKTDVYKLKKRLMAEVYKIQISEV